MTIGTSRLKDAKENPMAFFHMQCGGEGPFFISYKWDVPIDEEQKEPTDESEIILLTELGFIVEGAYHLPNAWRVTEYDINGNAIYRIPFDACDAIYSVEEYNCLCQMRDADETLLSYAR